MRTPKPFPEVRVVGMHFRGDYAKAAVENMEPPLELELEREPENAFDSMAIKVNYNGQHIGYVERGQAAFISPWMDQGHKFTCVVERLETVKNNLHPICTISAQEPTDA